MAGLYNVARVDALRSSEAPAYWEGGPANDKRRLGPYMDWPYESGWWHGSNWPDVNIPGTDPQYANFGIPQSVGMASNYFRSPYAWGIIYQRSNSANQLLNTSTNTMVNIKIGTLDILYNDGTWVERNNIFSVDGAFYEWSFSGDTTYPGDHRQESDGTHSARPVGRYNWHFFWGGKDNQPNPENVRGVCVGIQGKLTLKNPAGVDDRASAGYVIHAGCDLYFNKSLSDQFGGTEQFRPIFSAPAIGAGGFGVVKNDWELFTFTSLTAAEFASNPPPRFRDGPVDPPPVDPEEPGPVLPIISAPLVGTWQARNGGAPLISDWGTTGTGTPGDTSRHSRRPLMQE